MKINVFLFLLVVVVSLGGALFYQGYDKPLSTAAPIMDVSVPPLPQNSIPSFEINLLHDGSKKVIPSDTEGKVVLLNFWASWCAPCIVEFPILVEVAEKFRKDLVFIGLSSDIESAAIDNFFHKINFVPKDSIWMAHDNRGLITREKFQTFMLPETLLIDAQGRVVKKYVGVDWKKEEMISDIEKLLNY